MSNHYGITPSRAAQFLRYLADAHSGVVPQYVLDDLPRLFDGYRLREAAISAAWHDHSDQIASALRKHGYDAWGQNAQVSARDQDGNPGAHPRDLIALVRGAEPRQASQGCASPGRARQRRGAVDPGRTARRVLGLPDPPRGGVRSPSDGGPRRRSTTCGAAPAERGLRRR